MRHAIFALAFCLSLSAFAAKNEVPVTSKGSNRVAVGFADTSHVTTSQTASALFSVNQSWIQAVLGVNRTDGNFVFSAGGMYKHTIAGDRYVGFHVGPGITLGSTPSTKVVVTAAPGVTATTSGKTNFAMAFFGVAGAHYTLFDRLLLSVDGGPMLTVNDDDSNFSLKPLGELLGLSVHYLF